MPSTEYLPMKNFIGNFTGFLNVQEEIREVFIAKHKNVFLSIMKFADPKYLLQKTGLVFSFFKVEEIKLFFFFLVEPSGCIQSTVLSLHA